MCVTLKHTVNKIAIRAPSGAQGMIFPNRAVSMNTIVRFRTKIKTAISAELHVKMKMVLVHRC
jgi:hypothetical protein